MDEHRGPASDAAYLASYLQTISGPIVLVGHSYGGFVITNAALGNPNVRALVYIDAFLPDEGQTIAERALTQRHVVPTSVRPAGEVLADGTLTTHARLTAA